MLYSLPSCSNKYLILIFTGEDGILGLEQLGNPKSYNVKTENISETCLAFEGGKNVKLYKSGTETIDLNQNRRSQERKSNLSSNTTNYKL